jgi:hypothetical protein
MKYMGLGATALLATTAIAGMASAQGVPYEAFGTNYGPNRFDDTIGGTSTGYDNFAIQIEDSASFAIRLLYSNVSFVGSSNLERGPSTNDAPLPASTPIFFSIAPADPAITGSYPVHNGRPYTELAVAIAERPDDIVLDDLDLEAGSYQLIVGPALGAYEDFIFNIEFEILTLDLGPTVEQELANLLAASGGSARLVVIGADGVVRNAGAVSLATRDGQLSLTRVAAGPDAGSVVMSTSDAPGMMGNVYTWAEVTGFRSDTFGSGDGTLEGGGLQIGADVALGPDMVAGVSLGYTNVTASDAGTSSEGGYTYFQPYLAYRSGNWGGTASLMYGRGSFDQTSAGGDGSADVTIAALTFEGGYDHALSDRLTLTPTLGLLHGREETEGASGTLAGTTGDVTFSQLSLGGRLTQSGANGSFFTGLHADYLTQEASSILAGELLGDEGWTGRIELGAESALSSGLGLSTSVELRGLGGDFRTVSGGLRVAFTF